MRAARKNSWRSMMVFAKASRAGMSFWCAYVTRAAFRPNPSLQRAMAALGFLESHQEDLADHQTATLLGAQDGQCSELSAQVGSEERLRAIFIRSTMPRTELEPMRPSIVSSRSMGQNMRRRAFVLPRIATRLLAFLRRPCRALAACPQYQSHREHVRDGTIANQQDQRLPVT